MYVCMYVYVCVCVCVYVSVCLCVCMYVRTYVQYVCTRSCQPIKQAAGRLAGPLTDQVTNRPTTQANCMQPDQFNFTC